VYSSEHIHRVEIVKEILESEGIAVINISKRDSAYNNFGMHEVHVQADDVIKAIRKIEDIEFE